MGKIRIRDGFGSAMLIGTNAEGTVYFLRGR
jgi:hypothetical protein